MGRYEVTHRQYQKVMGENPSNWKGDNLPAESMNWNQAEDFCEKASRILGEEVRLPSEAEWEYACRAGTTGSYAGDLNSMGWYTDNSGGKTHPVGQQQRNAWGLYDMHGNVWEWCEDWDHDTYNGVPGDGGAWISPAGQYRVLRGGSWGNYARNCRSAARGRIDPENAINNRGFRVVVGSR